MTETLVLSRYKDKNPAAKQAVATQRIVNKVKKANKRKRLESMTKTLEQRLSQMESDAGVALGPLGKRIAELDLLGITPQISVREDGSTTITATEKDSGNVAVKLTVPNSGDAEILELSSSIGGEAAFRGMTGEDKAAGKGAIKLVGTLPPTVEQTEQSAKQQGIDRYAETVRQRSRDQEQEITLSDVQAYAKEHGIPADGDAYRALQQDRMHDEQSKGSTPPRQDSGDLKKIIEDRGYDLDA